MNLLSHSSVTKYTKHEGDEEPMKSWKSHNGECHLIHQKVDIIASRIRVSFYAAGKGSEEFARLRARCGKCGKEHNNSIPLI